jgi:hypothetical protein
MKFLQRQITIREFASSYLVLVLLALCFVGCSEEPNRLVGHTYVIAPVSSIFKMKLGMSMATIEHEYKSNDEVLITTYIGKEATKKESQSYTFDGAAYTMDNEHYDVTFAGDTASFSVNGEVLFRLEPVK